MPLKKYMSEVSDLHKSGKATEHSYRPALQKYLTELFSHANIDVTNEPKRQKCGAPDYILSKKGIDVGYIEAKDIGVDLDKTEKSEQLKRYRESLDNLILTDYLEFYFFVNGEIVDTVAISKVEKNKIIPLPENFDRLESLLNDFIAFQGQTIKSAKMLAEMMARKARLMKNVFYNAVKDEDENSSLHSQFEAFKAVLVHDMNEEQFADVYAQTVAYGLFTARLHDKTLQDFSRQEALLLIPKSNPFLRQLFVYVAGPQLDDRVVWIVDALCEVYRATDLRAILKDFGTATGENDPILHFYETFLGEYDKKLKKARGVWYTPEPVVNFIVRAIDDVLKKHFDIKDGLADTSKVKIQVEAQETDKRTKTGRKMFEREVHKVQLLDVATGTGTFLAETVKQIYSLFKGQEGLWSSYIEHDLLPRLHGFELLMASYAICHMKLDLLLQETGYKPSNPQKPPRLSVYLTNSLEEHHPEMETLFAKWLSHEANEASKIKKDMPVMVAYGNPPYSGISSNMSSWIAKEKIKDYKYIEGVHFKERKHWLNDDYVQFIRLGEHYIEKNGEGILAYISNHSYLDNPTFRGMRWHLLNTFDDIYILDLHGNSKRKEVTPDGSKDVNVFDIQQGVAIIIAVKKQAEKGKKPLAAVHHADLYGKREYKYETLKNTSLKSIKWNKINYRKPFYFFIPKNYDSFEEYQEGFSVNDLFKEKTVGCVTGKDKITISFSSSERKEKLDFFIHADDSQIRSKFSLKEKDARDWTVSTAQEDAKKNNAQNNNLPIVYRPFDRRFTLYTGNSRGFYASPQKKIMHHLLAGRNRGLVTTKINRQQSLGYVFCTREIVDFHILDNARDSTSLFPLYIYNNFFENTEDKTPNFNPEIYTKITGVIKSATPENLFDYIYAVLHSLEYRKRYAEFLKSDFPKIPYPLEPKSFYELAKFGAQLCELHLMESEQLNDLITTYPVDGDHEVKKICFEDRRVWINKMQYFGEVPQVAWEFYIGGYQPAQKWLKDRKGRKLSTDEIRHWQRIIVALTETDRIMNEIASINFLPTNR